MREGRCFQDKVDRPLGRSSADMMVTFFKAGKSGTLRFCTVHDLQRSLLGKYSITVVVSVGDMPGKDVLHFFEDEFERLRWLDAFFSRKRRSGYRELYSYGYASRRGDGASCRAVRRVG